MFLVVKEGNETGRVYKVREGNTIIGRNPSCQIVLTDDVAVSRQHFKLTRQPNGLCTITDLNSTNGTMLDGRRLLPNIPAVLMPGIPVQVGKTTFELVVEYHPAQSRRLPGSHEEPEFNTESMVRRTNDTRRVREELITEFLPESSESKT